MPKNFCNKGCCIAEFDAFLAERSGHSSQGQSHQAATYNANDDPFAPRSPSNQQPMTAAGRGSGGGRQLNTADPDATLFSL